MIAHKNFNDYFWNDCVPVKPKMVDGYLEMCIDGSGRKVRYGEIDPSELTYAKHVEL